jgi:predicted AlkP superfamily pyrophosphatase or phosphodiesterase
VNGVARVPGVVHPLRPMRRLLALGLLLLAPSPAAAQAPADDPSKPLVYVFSLDGFDRDRLENGTAPYLQSLVRGAEPTTNWQESRAIMVAQTNPNHVAMATGAFADRSGIPGNAFVVYGREARQACGGEPGDGPEALDGETPDCLVAEPFFTTAGRAGLPTAGIFGKPKLARIFETRRLDPSRPDATFLWAPCTNGSGPSYCDRNVPARPNDGYSLNDRDVMDVVLRTVREGVGTPRRRPLLTFVNFPNIDSAGHATGAGSAYDAAVRLADTEVQRFVAAQKAAGLWERTVMFVVSDHSMDSTPTKTTLGDRFDAAGIPSDSYLIQQNGSLDMVYLRDRAAPGRFALLQRMRATALSDPRVDEALYRQPNPEDGGTVNTLDGAHPGWRVAGERTGDLVVTHRPGGSFSDPFNPLPGEHGGPQTTDNLLLVAGGGLVRGQDLAAPAAPRFDDTLANPGQAQNVDVAPTALALLGLRAPATNEGRVLAEAFNERADPLVRAAALPGCTPADGLTSVRVSDARGGVLVRASRTPAATGRARAELFRQSAGRLVLGNRRTGRVTLTGGRAVVPAGGDGLYVLRVTVAVAGGRTDVRRIALERRSGRFRVLRAYAARTSCGLLSQAKLERPVFGGTRNRALGIAARLARPARLTVTVRRGSRLVQRFVAPDRGAGVTRLRLPAERLARGTYTVTIEAVAGSERVVTTLSARRL